MTLVLVVLFGLMLLGIPVAFAILSAGMAYLATTGGSMLVVAQRLIYGLNVTAVTFLDQESHGIEQGIGGNALFARAKTAPRFYFRQVPGIGFRADLEL